MHDHDTSLAHCNIHVHQQMHDHDASVAYRIVMNKHIQGHWQIHAHDASLAHCNMIHTCIYIM